MKQMRNEARVLKLLAFLCLFLGIALFGKHPVYAFTVDVSGIETSGTIPVYHLTKGTSDSIAFQIPARTEEMTAADGSIYYETAYPEITKISNSKPAIVGYDNGTITGYVEGTSKIKVSYRYKFSSYTVKETASVYVRVVAYSRSGNTLTFDPNLLVNGDITYSLCEASAEARDNATDTAPYTIRIPAGNYVLSDIVHLYSNITIDMDAATIITSTASTGSNMFLLGTTGEYLGEANYNQSELCAGYGGFHDITIRGGILVGNDKNKSCLMRMAHATNVTLENVTFSGGAGSHQLEVAAIDGFYVKNCVFKDFYGLKGVTGNYEALQIDIPVAQSPYPDTYEDGTTMRNVEITGCTFQNLSKGVGTHTTLIGAYHENIKINNNLFSNITNEAILCQNYYNCEIKNNTIENCGAGIDFGYYLMNNYCVYNTIFDGTQTYSNGIRHNAKTVISGNNMTINYTTGYVSCNGINVYGYNRTTKGTGAAGNSIKAQNYYVSGVTIDNNTIVTAGYGIRLSDAKKCSITKNIITGKNFSENDSHIKSGYTYDGIYITQKSSTVKLTQNTIKNMNGGGIYLSNSTALGGITDNTIKGVKRYGIYLYSGAKAKIGITGNKITSTSTAEALIYLNTASATRQIITGNTLKGYKTNAAIRIDSGKFTISDNTISRVSDGVIVADGVSGYIYANTCSSKAASRVKFTDKNYYMSAISQTRMKTSKSGTLEPELPAVKKISGYEIQVSTSKNFDKDVQVYRLKKSADSSVIEGLTANKKYYVRAYAYKTYKGVRIYKNS
jgi:parallel beta-helix repeat protein